MGCCNSIKSRPKQPTIIQTCPICEQFFDLQQRKPMKICSHHTLCEKCMKASMKHSVLNKKEFVLCPFCRQRCTVSRIAVNSGIEEFMNDQGDILSKLKDNQRKLYSFVCIYHPKLYNMMKQHAGDRLNIYFQKLRMLAIKGRMLIEYEDFDMEVFNCLPRLESLLLNHNRIKTLNTTLYDHTSLQILNLSGNQIISLTTLFQSNYQNFVNLRLLNVSKNLIENILGMDKLQYLSHLNLSHNKITKFFGIQKLKELTYLNLENNQISSFQGSYDRITRIRSLLLFENPIPSEQWYKFLSLIPKKLHLLTCSIEKTISEREYILYHIRQQNQLNIQLVIAQNDAATESITTKLKSVGVDRSKPTLLQITKRAYNHLVNDRKQNILKTTCKNIVMNRRLGQHIHFKPAEFNKSVYSHTKGSDIFQKISQANEPQIYLYHRQDMIKSNQFIVFRSKTRKIIVGVCQTLAGFPNSIQINLQNSHDRRGDEVGWVSVLPEEQRDIEWIISMKLPERLLQIHVNDLLLFWLPLPFKSQKLKFFIHLLKQGEQIRVISPIQQ